MKPTKPKDQRRSEATMPDLREEVSRKNMQALVELLARHQLRLSRSLADWRPTQESVGTIAGLESLGDLTILATDGVAAFFRQQDDQIFYGHIQHFTGDVKPLFSVPSSPQGGGVVKPRRRPSPESVAKRAKTLADRAEFLAQFD